VNVQRPKGGEQQRRKAKDTTPQATSDRSLERQSFAIRVRLGVATRSLDEGGTDKAKRANKGGAREGEDGRASRAGGSVGRALKCRSESKVSRLVPSKGDSARWLRRTGMVELDDEALDEAAAAAEPVDEADEAEVVMREDDDDADDEADDEDDAADDDDEAAAAEVDSVSPSEVMLNMFDWARMAVVLGLTKLIW